MTERIPQRQQPFTVTINGAATTDPANPFASVVPAAPTSVAFVPPTGGSSQITHLNNSTNGTALQFLVSGVTKGNLVEVLADGTPIGQATATDSSLPVTVTTDGSTKLTDGAHTFTAIQIAPGQTVTVNESNGSSGTTPFSQTADVPSLILPPCSLRSTPFCRSSTSRPPQRPSSAFPILVR